MNWRLGVAVLAILTSASFAPRTAVAQGAAGFDLASLNLPPGFLEVSDVSVVGPRPGVVVGLATTTLAGNVTQALISSFEAGSGRRLLLALKPVAWSLTKTFPALSNPILDELTFEYVALVLANEDLKLTSSEMSVEEREFYGQIYRTDAFTLDVKAGVNLIAAIPAEGLPPTHPLNVIMDVFGIEKGTIFIQGTLGKSLTALTSPATMGLSALKDVSLRAELPPMRPPRSPDWFVSGQVALEITGLPSLRVVGELNVKVQEDQLMFFVAAGLSRTGMTLAGGLKAEEGWNAPFGIQWLTLNKVVLMLGVSPVGSVQLGFAGDAVFGSKDIAVAVLIAISPAGVPTNLILQGESEAGIGFPDLVAVQQKMAAAAGRDDPVLSLDALPDIAIKDMGLKFAPAPAPELEVAAGMAIKGRLWMPTSPGGEMKDFAGVDVNVGSDGIWIRGDIGKFELGPLSMDDSKLDITRTPEVQHFMVKGGVELFGTRQEIDLMIERRSFSFRSETVLWDLFSARIEAQAAFDLQAPKFMVHADMQNDFATVIEPFLSDGLRNFAAGGEQLLESTERMVTNLDELLADREADLERVQAALVALRARADEAAAVARAAALQSQGITNQLRRAANEARNDFNGTPARSIALRAQRQAIWVAAEARWRARVGITNGLLATLRVRERVIELMPPIEQSVAVMGARAALDLARERAQTMRNNLQTMQERYTLVTNAVAGGITLPLTISSASFDSNLEGITRGEAAAWKINGTFLGSPFAIERALDFSNVANATAQIVQDLIG